MSGQPAVLQVVILRDGLLVGTEVLIPGAYALGSAPDSDLKLDDPSVAGKHAMLYFQNGKAAIQDTGGTSGIYVNGHKVTACQIRSVDEVSCGPFVLKVRVLSQKPEQKGLPPEVAALLQKTPAQGSLPASAQPPMGRATAPPSFIGTEPTVHSQKSSTRETAPANGSPTAGPRTMLSHRRMVEAEAAAAARALAQPPPPANGLAANELFGDLELPNGTAQPLDGAFDEPYVEDNPTQQVELPVEPPTLAEAPPAPPQVIAAGRRQTPNAVPIPRQAVAPVPKQHAKAETPLPTKAQPKAEAAPAPKPQARPEPAPKQPVVMPPANGPQPPEPQPTVVGRSPPPAPSRPAMLDPAIAVPKPSRLPRTVRPQTGGKGAPRVYFEVYWGDIRRDARSFKRDQKQPVRAAASESLPGKRTFRERVFQTERPFLPLYGFTLSEDFVLAEAEGDGFRVFVPTGAAVERCKVGEKFSPVDAKTLEVKDGRRSLLLNTGTAARLWGESQMSVLAYVAPPPEKIFVNPLRQLPVLALCVLLLLSVGFGYFLSLIPETPENPDFAAKNLSPVAVRLIAPEPKKKEEAQKKLKEIKETRKKEEKVDKVEKVVKQVEKSLPKAVAAAPESKALKALAKLSAAGPAMGDMLAAVDKLGNGPGSKNVKSSNFKLSGLIGKAPIANAGLGTFGLGGGGKGGIGTLGAEILRGKGGGGIGALGAGGVGKGAVGGTVTRASARSVAVQGSIDREAVAKVVNSHLQEIRGCYERALLKDPSLAGKVVLEWAISTTGNVVSVKTKNSTLRNSAVEACIMNELKGWVFPPPRGGQVLITYPFLFNSVGY